MNTGRGESCPNLQVPQIVLENKASALDLLLIPQHHPKAFFLL